MYIDYNKIYKKVYLKFNEVSTKAVMKKIAEFIQQYMKKEITLDEFKDYLLRTVCVSANSYSGIVCDDTGIAELGTRIDSLEHIYRLLIYSCNKAYDGNSSMAKRSKETLNRDMNEILSFLEKGIKQANINIENNNFNLTAYIKDMKI